MQLLLAASVVLGALTGSTALRAQRGLSFDDYCASFGKRYTPEEHSVRQNAFEHRLSLVLAHNEEGGHSYTKGLNQFSDWTDAEHEALLGYTRPPAAVTAAVSSAAPSYVAGDVPDNVDWRACSPFADSELCPLDKPASAVTTAVKDQGSCGSCWAFASTAVLESHLAIATGELQNLSPQHFVSCAPNPNHCGGVGGCKGSTADVAFEWLAAAGGNTSAGLTTEFKYGYNSGADGDTGTCDDARAAVAVAAVTGIVKPGSNDYAGLMHAVATIGPVAVNVYASDWRDYESGIFDGCPYTEDLDLNHVVALEGYGVDPELGAYWLIRNSWAVDYGEGGYIRLRRESTEQCGTDKAPANGWDCVTPGPLPDNVTVCGQCGVAYEPTLPAGVHRA